MKTKIADGEACGSGAHVEVWHDPEVKHSVTDRYGRYTVVVDGVEWRVDRVCLFRDGGSTTVEVMSPDGLREGVVRFPRRLNDPDRTPRWNTEPLEPLAEPVDVLALCEGVDPGGCRHWPEGADDRCGKPSEFVLWGKLYPPEALGPRCYDHASLHMSMDERSIRDSAVIDLRPLRKFLDSEARA